MHLTASVCCSVYGGSDLLSASCLGAKVALVQSENRLSGGSDVILQWIKAAVWKYASVAHIYRQRRAISR